MINFITKHKITFLGIMTGAIGGYAYYHFVGCASGICPITSTLFNSTSFGALMGGLLFSGFKKENEKQ